MRKPHFFRICGLLLLSIIFCLPVWGQIKTISSAPQGLEPAATLSFSVNRRFNIIDDSVTAALVVGPGLPSMPNKLGLVGGMPVGTDYNPGWSADSAYVAGSAGYSSILGGYDQVLNSIGSVIVNSNHSMIGYGVQGHHTIVGNSYNYIAGSAARGGIFAGHASTITSGYYSLILGGDSHEITTTGASNTIVNGLNSAISGTYSFGSIIGARNSTVSGGNWSVLLGGDANTISATSGLNSIINSIGSSVSGGAAYATIVGGNTNTLTGVGAVTLGGANNTNMSRAAVAMGEDASTLAPGGLHIGRSKLVEAGDAQSISFVAAVRTSDATLTNLTGTAGIMPQLPSGKVVAGTGRVWLVGLRDGSADGNNDGDYTQVAYVVEFGFWWNGTNGFLFKTGTETAVTGAPTLNMDLVSQTNNDFAVGAAPHIAINTGALRPKVTGIAGVKINWVARIDLVMTVIS